MTSKPIPAATNDAVPPAAPARRGRPRGSVDQREMATRKMLLKGTRDVMVAKNSVNLSLSEISEVTGTSPGLISYHFQNKEGLLLAVIMDDADAAIKQVEGLRSMDIPPEQKIRLHISGIINAYFKRPYANRLLNEIIENAGAETSRQVVDIFLKPIADFQRAVLEEGSASGQLRPMDPADFFFIVLGACEQLFARRAVLNRLFGQDAQDEEVKRRYSRTLTDLIMDGLLPTDR